MIDSSATNGARSSNAARSKKSGGIGIGSASIVLIFSVLCLTIFTLITFIVASNDKALVEAEVRFVTGYYEADTLAEHILAEILTVVMSQEPSASQPGIYASLPATVSGIDIETVFDEQRGIETIYYLCPISEIKTLYVSIAVRDGSYDILSWHMINVDDWVSDNTINVWPGY